MNVHVVRKTGNILIAKTLSMEISLFQHSIDNKKYPMNEVSQIQF